MGKSEGAPTSIDAVGFCAPLGWGPKIKEWAKEKRSVSTTLRFSGSQPESHQVQTITPVELSQVFADCE